MLSSFLTVSLALGLATAAPTARQTPAFAPYSTSNAFNLVANVTNTSSTLGASIQNYVLTGYHTGAGLSTAVLIPNTTVSSGRIFYENGTAETVYFGNGSVISDGGTPPFPFGIIVQNETEFDYSYPTEHDVYLNAGEGTREVGIQGFPEQVPKLYAPGSGTFIACNNTIPYSGDAAITVQYAYATYTNATGGYDYEENIPEGCVEIQLLPQCTTINELPEGSTSSHEFAVVVNCYENVSAIDWTIYTA